MEAVSINSILTVLAICLLAGVLLWTLAHRYSDFREAGIEARHMPEGQIVDVGGQSVHVVVLGDGPDLVLIHGAGGSAKDFTFDLARRLAERYRVFAVDRPGLGWSERADPALSGPFAAGSESPIMQARHLSRAVSELGANTPIILGHSYGGAVAMGWALEAPASGLVVLSGATMPWPGEIDWTYRVLGTAVGGAILPPVVSSLVTEGYVEGTLANVFAPDPVPDGYLRHAGIMMATRIETLRANARQVKALRPHVVEMSKRYGDITLPVEIIHGTADTSVPPDIHAIPLSGLLPNAALTLLDGHGHMPHHATPSDIVAAVDRVARKAGLR